MMKQLESFLPLMYSKINLYGQTKLMLYFQRILNNPKWLLMFLLARFGWVRSMATFLLSKEVTQSLKLQYSLFPELDIETVANSLKRDGLYLGIHLPNPVVQEILDFALKTDCYGGGKFGFGFTLSEKEQVEQEEHKSFYMAQYYNTQRHCPAIAKLASDPKLIAIASRYLGVPAVHTGNRLWWVFVTERTPYDADKRANCTFHYDLDDYKSLRFFFYLTDVDLHSSPHVCVRGSHQRKKLIHLLSYSRQRLNEDIINYYGSENIVTICGQAGFGFAEDTYCFHKGTEPTQKDRLILQIQFARHDYGNQNDIVDPALLHRLRAPKTFSTQS